MTVNLVEYRYLIQGPKQFGKGGITPRSYSPSGSIGLTVWPQFAITRFGWAFDPQIFPSTRGQRPPSNTVCHWAPLVYLRNGI